MAAGFNKTQGTQIAYDAGGSPVLFVAIKNVTNISEGGAQTSESDVTNLDSSAMEFTAGLVDQGTLTLAINWDFVDATHQHLQAAFDAQLTESYKITFTAGSPATTATFNAFVQGVTRDHAINSVVKAQLTLRITGPVVIA